MKYGAFYLATLLWIVPCVFMFLVFSTRSRKRILERFCDKKIIPEIAGSVNEKRRKTKNWILVVAVFLLIFSLMRPQWGFQWQEVKRRGIDIMIALDTSNSMLAEDVLPNRLERAKLAIKDLIRKLHGDRIGLVAFAGQAFLQCPLTVDYNGFLLALDDLDVNVIPVGGTSISEAIYVAMNSYEGGDGEDKVLIIITDGEDLEGGLERAVERAKQNGIKIFCVGIGSMEGELIPVKDKNGKKVFLKDKEGNIVKTRLVEETLKKMAFETGGMYIHATGAEFGLDLIYEEKLSKMQKKDFEARMEKRYTERFQIPLGVAVFLLFLGPLLGDKRKGFIR